MVRVRVNVRVRLMQSLLAGNNIAWRRYALHRMPSYDTIRYDISTCTQELAIFSLIYRTEPEKKQ